MLFFRRINNFLKGNYRIAVENGLNVGKEVSIMGKYKGVNFGTEPYLITIGDYVRISFGVCFVTHDGGTWVFRDQEKYKNIIKYGRISVGSHSFIGCNSTILPGVRIGERCVVGAGSVVTKDIPDGVVVAGVPAKIVMTTEEYAEKCLSRQEPYDRESYMKDKKAFLLKWLD